MNSSSIPNSQDQESRNTPRDTLQMHQSQEEPEQVEEPLNLALGAPVQLLEPNNWDQCLQSLFVLQWLHTFRLASQHLVRRPMGPNALVDRWPLNVLCPNNRPEEPVPQPIPQVAEAVAVNPLNLENRQFPCGDYMVQRKSPDSFILFIVNNPVDKAKAICEKCRKIFFNAGSIYRHRKIHTGEKLACPLCPSKHTQKYNLRLHMETHIGTDFDLNLFVGMSDEFKGVLLGNPKHIRPEKYRKRLEMALRKRESAKKMDENQ